ncbi:hypothetical protein X777_04574 [Ooceraea biroi]|uniref:GIY-YIG domain-containing protein n=1 Tax=Ooceraea biroi TaxID=2015173 RepID=A0A026WHK4_OOCBI|nr:hypothetical protein X777_04574 [Ooceraea biroi]
MIPKKLDHIIKRGKDVLTNMRKNGVVYKFDCQNCNSCYVGQTKQHLEVRIKEHKCDIKKHVSNQSVVSKHRLSNNHEFDWVNTKVLHQESHWKRREIAEMCFIKRQEHSINVQKDTENLLDVYDSIFKCM